MSSTEVMLVLLIILIVMAFIILNRRYTQLFGGVKVKLSANELSNLKNYEDKILDKANTKITTSNSNYLKNKTIDNNGEIENSDFVPCLNALKRENLKISPIDKSDINEIVKILNNAFESIPK